MILKPSEIRPPFDEEKAKLKVKAQKRLGIYVILNLSLKRILKIQSGETERVFHGRINIIKF